MTQSQQHHTPEPYRFDGHGVNDNEGQRIAKLSDCGTIPTLIERDGNMRRNPEFDRVGELLASAPTLQAENAKMREALELWDKGYDPEGINWFEQYTHAKETTRKVLTQIAKQGEADAT